MRTDHRLSSGSYDVWKKDDIVFHRYFRLAGSMPNFAAPLPIGRVSDLKLRWCSFLSDLPPPTSHHFLCSQLPNHHLTLMTATTDRPSSLSSAPKARERSHTAILPSPSFPEGPVCKSARGRTLPLRQNLTLALLVRRKFYSRAPINPIW
jgi:hypothetical protein